ncbi:DUF218 domain protein [Aspergillus flavus]|nr:DUF218 domain protein [Aspergillus flavus]
MAIRYHLAENRYDTSRIIRDYNLGWKEGMNLKALSERLPLFRRLKHTTITVLMSKWMWNQCPSATQQLPTLPRITGATKKDRTSLTEGESYLALAQENNYFSYTVPPAQIIPETHATDSYQNVLFSLLRFKLYTGVYPSRVTVVTHEFKRRRFMEYHFPAIGLVPVVRGSGDEGRAAVIGINPPEEVTPEASLIEGEEKRGIGLWMRDRYGVLSELKEKRVKRGWVEGMEEGLFVNVGLEEVVEKLVRWEGGISGNEWFSRMEDLPWYSSGDIL